MALRPRFGWTWGLSSKKRVNGIGLPGGLPELLGGFVLPLLLGWRHSVMVGLVVRGDFLLLFLNGAFTDTVSILERKYHGGDEGKGNI
jgi:hypothetical protein